MLDAYEDRGLAKRTYSGLLIYLPFFLAGEEIACCTDLNNPTHACDHVIARGVTRSMPLFDVVLMRGWRPTNIDFNQ